MALDFANPYARITPEQGASYQDFTFGKSAFLSVDGNPDGMSTQYGASVSDVALARSLGEDPRYKKDKDEDGLSWDDVRDARERMREQIRQISAGGITFSEEDLDIADAIRNDPNLQDRVREKLIAQGQDPQKAAQSVSDYLRLTDIAKRKLKHEPISSSDLAFEQEIKASPERKAGVESAANAARIELGKSNDITPQNGLNASEAVSGSRNSVIAATTTSDLTLNNQRAAMVSDDNTWLAARVAQGSTEQEVADFEEARSGSVDFLAFDDTRAGPVITAQYNATATGETTPQLASAQPTDAPITTPLNFG